jgi:ribonuclease VapC
LFLDASAIVAMMIGEPDARALADRLDEHDTLLWSPIVRWEALVAIVRERGYSPSAARSDLYEFGKEYGFEAVSIGDDEFDLAYRAYRLYGKGTGHPAKLNMGDCFAYACAKAHQAQLLYKGDDFAQTDLADARR